MGVARALVFSSLAATLEASRLAVLPAVPVSAPLPLPRTASLSSTSVPLRKAGATSSTTRYWFSSVKMVEIWRWPKAS